MPRWAGHGCASSIPLSVKFKGLFGCRLDNDARQRVSETPVVRSVRSLPVPANRLCAQGSWAVGRRLKLFESESEVSVGSL